MMLPLDRSTQLRVLRDVTTLVFVEALREAAGREYR